MKPGKEKENTEQNSRLGKQHQRLQQQKLPKKRKIKFLDYLKDGKIQRKIEIEIELGKTVSLFDSVCATSATDRNASNYTDAGNKLRKIRIKNFSRYARRHQHKRITRTLLIQGHGEP